jgi:hypothetical protein
MPYDPRAAGARCDECSLGGQFVVPKCVPPKGPPNARIAFVGEGPGVNELKKLEPFVGASGIKLEEILWEAGLTRPQVFITNSALCRAEVPDKEGPGRYSMEEYMKWLKKENGRRATINKQRKKQAKKDPTLQLVPEPMLMDPHTACRPRLLRELKWLDEQARAAGAPNGLSVMPLGNFALKSLRGITSIMKYRGSVFLPRPRDFAEDV